MTPDQARTLLSAFLSRRLVKNEASVELVNIGVNYALDGFDAGANDWDQLSRIKQRLDDVWIAFKHCSELDIIPARVLEVKKAFDKIRRK